MKKGHRMKLFTGIAAICLITQLIASEREEFQIDVPGIQQVYPVDMDNDGDLDLIVVHHDKSLMEEETRRFISIYRQDRGFPSRPSARYAVPGPDAVFDWGDTDRDGLMELLFVRPDGIWIWYPAFSCLEDSGRSCRLIGAHTLFTGPDRSELVQWNFIKDIDEDGKPELTLPEFGGFHFYGQDSLGLFQLLHECRIPLEHRIQSRAGLALQIYLPEIRIADMDLDHNPDLLFILKEKIILCLGSGQKIWPTMADSSVFRIMRFAADNPHLSMLEALAPAENHLEIEDLNNDGFKDIILSRASMAGFTKTLSQLQLYYSRNGTFDILPDQVLAADNFYGDHFITDLNMDGRPDLALLQFPIGLVGAARFLITQKMKVGFDIYLMKTDGRYPDIPDQQLRFTRRSKIRNVLRPEVAAFSDWNGDGRPDLLVNVNHQQIIVFLQTSAGLFDKKPAFKIRMPVSPENRIGDLNHDGRADLILWYPDTGKMTVLLSRGAG
ncbi:VCBS repeat-containing protein [bacterium]|nr:VCBS repeat-containing protein [bacterium]